MEVIVKHATPIYESEFKAGDLVISKTPPERILMVEHCSNISKDLFPGIVLQDLNVVPHVVGFRSTNWIKKEYQQFFGAIILKSSEL